MLMLRAACPVLKIASGTFTDPAARPARVCARPSTLCTTMTAPITWPTRANALSTRSGGLTMRYSVRVSRPWASCPVTVWVSTPFISSSTTPDSRVTSASTGARASLATSVASWRSSTRSCSTWCSTLSRSSTGTSLPAMLLAVSASSR